MTISNTDSLLIGVVGADLPRQIILATNAVPVRLFGSWAGTASHEANELLGAADAVSIRILTDILSGSYDDLAGVVVCNDTMANLRMYYVLRILSDRGRIPFRVHLLDTPRGGGQHRNQFVSKQYRRLAEFLTSLTGQAIDSDSLNAAAASEWLLCESLNTLRSLRELHRVPGSIALSCYILAVQQSPEQAAKAINKILVEQEQAAAGHLKEQSAAFLTGSSHPDPSLYCLLESSGILIVGEDHDTGDLAWVGEAVEAESPDAAFSALARQHALRPPSAARSLSVQRATHLLAEVRRTNCSQVIALIREYDDAPAWDLPVQQQLLESNGISLASSLQIAAEGARDAAASLVSALQLPKGITT